MVQKITNVVFGGTGVRNPAYVGGLLALEDRGLYQDVTGFAGTSAGAIVAALAGLGYSPQEILKTIIEMDFKAIPGGSVLLAPFRLACCFGWFNASYLVETLGKLVQKKVGDSAASIEACQEATGKRIRIVGTNLSRREARVFPDISAPQLPLVEAVRISMSIPLFFVAPRLSRELYVDGGVLWNMPVEIFDTGKRADMGTVGMVVTEPKDRSVQSIRWPHDYGLALLRTLVQGQEASLRDIPTARSRVIMVSDLGISPINFGLSQAQKWALVDAGRVAMNAFLEQRSATGTKESRSKQQMEVNA